MCNTTSLDYIRNQIPIPSSTGPLRPAVSQPHRAGGPGLRHPSASCRICASQRSRSACQPRQFRSPELLMMLHCNTLCISNHLFLQFWISSDAVTQGRAEDFTPRSTEFGVAFEEETLGNEQDVEAGWVPKRLQVWWSREGLREGGTGERKDGGRDIAAKEGFGCQRRGVRLGKGDESWEARSLPQSR